MDKVELYYTIPIFVLINPAPPKVAAPQIIAINRDYITSVASRALEDVDNGHYDRARKQDAH